MRKKIGLNEGAWVALKKEVSETFPFPCRDYLAIYIEENKRPTLYLFTKNFVHEKLAPAARVGDRGIEFIMSDDICPVGMPAFYETKLGLPYVAGQFARANSRSTFLKKEWFEIPVPRLKFTVLLKYWLIAPFRFFFK